MHRDHLHERRLYLSVSPRREDLVASQPAWYFAWAMWERGKGTLQCLHVVIKLEKVGLKQENPHSPSILGSMTRRATTTSVV
jgi:hypothetical protein